MLFEGSKGFHFVILSVQTGQIHCGRSRVPGSSDPCNHVFKMLNSLDPPCLDDKRHHSPSPHPSDQPGKLWLQQTACHPDPKCSILWDVTDGWGNEYGKQRLIRACPANQLFTNQISVTQTRHQFNVEIISSD